MTTTNTGSNCGNTNTNSNTNTNGSWPTSTTKPYGTSAATCTEYACGTTWNVNEISSPGCYVCNWNGSLLRVSDAAFTSSGFTSFNFTSCDQMTVTYLTDDPTTTIEECRTLASGSNVYCNF